MLKAKTGEKFVLLGHVLKITLVTQNEYEPHNPRVTATCLPHCCHHPNEITISAKFSDLAKLAEGK